MQKINLWFDMDGTIYNLYNVKGWLTMLRKEHKGVFTIGEPYGDINRINELCATLKATGKFNIGIITMLPKSASKTYQKVARKEKICWAKRNFPHADILYTVPFTGAKHKIPKDKNINILFDDNKKIVKAWNDKGKRFIGIKIIDENTIIENLEKFLYQNYWEVL